MKTFLTLSLLSLSLGAFAQSKVSFLKPKDGEIVNSTFEVEFRVDGMKVEKAGATKPNSGHHHLIIDGKPIPKGDIVPKDANHLHFGDGQTQTSVTLPAGQHILTMQFADGAHKSYGPEFSTSISINVVDEKAKSGVK